MTHQPKELDEILQEVYDIGWNDNLDQAIHGRRETKIISKAKQAILATHIPRSKVEEAIGEDDYITKPSGNSRFDQQVQSEINGANQLRAEIRQKLGLGAKDG